MTLATDAVEKGRLGAYLSALFMWLVLATAWAAPNFPALTGRVVDEAGLLKPQTRQQLEQMLAAHEQSTTEQVVVVTLKSLQGYNIEEFGYQLGRHWGIGQKDKDNGALLIVAPNEREVRIEVGYGLEGRLTDALAHTIIQTEILPRFREGNMEAGISAGAKAILAVLGGSYVPQAPPATQAPQGHVSGPASDGLPPFSFGMFLLLLVVGEALLALFKSKAISGSILAVLAVLAGLLMSGLLFALGLAFLVLVFHTANSGGKGGGRFGGGGFRSGSSSGGFSSGGFSGGCGSFGGGGASGRW